MRQAGIWECGLNYCTLKLMTGAQNVILAVGAHAGDMEVSCGAVLLKQVLRGDTVTLLHLTLGEGGNPKLPPREYGAQKKREAEAVARAIGAGVRFGPYRDGELPDNEEARRYVADVIREIKPTHIVTHWRHSIHPDHAHTHAIVTEAVLLASLEAVVTGHPRHRGVRAIHFTENWEDPEGFSPYLYVDVSETFAAWKELIVNYQFIKGGVSPFPYLEYYASLARVRGAESNTQFAVSFAVDPFERKRIVELLP